LFAFNGSVFLIVGLAIFISRANFRETALPATAVITEIETYRRDGETHHNVFVGYEVNGVQYNEELSFYSSSMREGQKTAILYNPENPREIDVESTGMFLPLFMGLGGMSFIVGAIILLRTLRKRLRAKRLVALGRIVDAAVLDIALNDSYTVTVNSTVMHPYRIICEWTDPASGIRHEFVSGHVWKMPGNLLSRREGDAATVPVYIDPMNPEEYHVAME
jgi:hypothetical protein